MQPELFDTRHPEGPVYEAYGILQHAIKVYMPEKIFALFSGGHDSLCSSHIASVFGQFAGCVHINTGIGVERTRQFVRETCAQFDWPLIEMHPPPFWPGRCKTCQKNKTSRPAREDCPDCMKRLRPGVDYANLPAYDALVLHYGFPGPGGHTVPYNRLKERCLRKLLKEQKTRKRSLIMLVGGMRKSESSRRMGTCQEHSIEGTRVWCAPIMYWSNEDKARYIESAGLPSNPVVKELCMSGECLCGAFARPSEIAELERHFPEAAARIHALEAKACEIGVHAVWGTKHPNSACFQKKQEEEPSFFGMCWSCGNKWEEPES